MRFTPHDDGPIANVTEFCVTGMQQRIRDLESALKSQQAANEHASRHYRRGVSELLKSHGLPDLEGRAADAAEQAGRMLALFTERS